MKDLKSQLGARQFLFAKPFLRSQKATEASFHIADISMKHNKCSEDGEIVNQAFLDTGYGFLALCQKHFTDFAAVHCVMHRNVVRAKVLKMTSVVDIATKQVTQYVRGIHDDDFSKLNWSKMRLSMKTRCCKMMSGRLVDCSSEKGLSHCCLK